MRSHSLPNLCSSASTLTLRFARLLSSVIAAEVVGWEGVFPVWVPVYKDRAEWDRECVAGGEGKQCFSARVRALDYGSVSCLIGHMRIVLQDAGQF